MYTQHAEKNLSLEEIHSFNPFSFNQNKELTSKEPIFQLFRLREFILNFETRWGNKIVIKIRFAIATMKATLILYISLN